MAIEFYVALNGIVRLCFFNNDIGAVETTCSELLVGVAVHQGQLVGYS